MGRAERRKHERQHRRLHGRQHHAHADVLGKTVQRGLLDMPTPVGHFVATLCGSGAESEVKAIQQGTHDRLIVPHVYVPLGGRLGLWHPPADLADEALSLAVSA